MPSSRAWTPTSVTRVTTAAYLERLGLDPDPEPTLDTLTAIHRAHVQQVPYDNLEIMLGRPVSVDPRDSLDRVATIGRAGYCFHQNGALEALLTDLGYAVRRHHGAVWFDPADRDRTDLNHLVLSVSGLPTEANPGGRWWPDAGLGEGFLDPVPLVVGTIHDGPLTMSVTEVSEDGWSFRNDPRGSFTGLEVRALPVGADAVEAAHRRLSTPPDGTFTKKLVVQRRDPDAMLTVRGCVVVRVDEAGLHQHEATTYDEWRDALAELRLPLADVPEGEVRALFDRTLVAHRAWVEEGRP